MDSSRNTTKLVLGSLVLRAQRAITQLGEAVGSEWLIYNPLVQMGFRRAGLKNAPIVCGSLVRIFGAHRRVLDVGCGEGIYLAEFARLGWSATGVEYSRKLRRRCIRRGLRVDEFDTARNTPPPAAAPFDIAVSFEVAEHVPPSQADSFVAYFRGLAEVVVFTAAQPGQGGTGHINEQNRDYWIDRFAQIGYGIDDEMTARLAAEWQAGGAHWYMCSNLCVFKARARAVF